LPVGMSRGAYTGSSFAVIMEILVAGWFQVGTVLN
jgi:hypothetical protein